MDRTSNHLKPDIYVHLGIQEKQIEVIRVDIFQLRINVINTQEYKESVTKISHPETASPTEKSTHKPSK